MVLQLKTLYMARHPELRIRLTETEAEQNTTCPIQKPSALKVKTFWHRTTKPSQHIWPYTYLNGAISAEKQDAGQGPHLAAQTVQPQLHELAQMWPYSADWCMNQPAQKKNALNNKMYADTISLGKSTAAVHTSAL